MRETDTDTRLQRRIQRYGWDLAARDYEPLWLGALAPAQARLLQCAALRPGEQVLDVASGRETWAEKWKLQNALVLFNPAPVT
jgi:hypothetical protein